MGPENPSTSDRPIDSPASPPTSSTSPVTPRFPTLVSVLCSPTQCSPVSLVSQSSSQHQGSIEPQCSTFKHSDAGATDVHSLMTKTTGNMQDAQTVSDNLVGDTVIVLGNDKAPTVDWTMTRIEMDKDQNLLNNVGSGATALDNMIDKAVSAVQDTVRRGSSGKNPTLTGQRKELTDAVSPCRFETVGVATATVSETEKKRRLPESFSRGVVPFKKSTLDCDGSLLHSDSEAEGCLVAITETTQTNLLGQKLERRRDETDLIPIKTSRHLSGLSRLTNQEMLAAEEALDSFFMTCDNPRSPESPEVDSHTITNQREDLDADPSSTNIPSDKNCAPQSSSTEEAQRQEERSEGKVPIVIQEGSKSAPLIPTVIENGEIKSVSSNTADNPETDKASDSSCPSPTLETPPMSSLWFYRIVNKTGSLKESFTKSSVPISLVLDTPAASDSASETIICGITGRLIFNGQDISNDRSQQTNSESASSSNVEAYSASNNKSDALSCNMKDQEPGITKLSDLAIKHRGQARDVPAETCKDLSMADKGNDASPELEKDFLGLPTEEDFNVPKPHVNAPSSIPELLGLDTLAASDSAPENILCEITGRLICNGQDMTNDKSRQVDSESASSSNVEVYNASSTESDTPWRDTEGGGPGKTRLSVPENKSQGQVQDVLAETCKDSSMACNVSLHFLELERILDSPTDKDSNVPKKSCGSAPSLCTADLSDVESEVDVLQMLLLSTEHTGHFPEEGEQIQPSNKKNCTRNITLDPAPPTEASIRIIQDSLDPVEPADFKDKICPGSQEFLIQPLEHREPIPAPANPSVPNAPQFERLGQPINTEQDISSEDIIASRSTEPPISPVQGANSLSPLPIADSSNARQGETMSRIQEDDTSSRNFHPEGNERAEDLFVNCKESYFSDLRSETSRDTFSFIDMEPRPEASNKSTDSDTISPVPDPDRLNHSPVDEEPPNSPRALFSESEENLPEMVDIMDLPGLLNRPTDSEVRDDLLLNEVLQRISEADDVQVQVMGCNSELSLCAGCGAPATTLCSGCLAVGYCGADCEVRPMKPNMDSVTVEIMK